MLTPTQSVLALNFFDTVWVENVVPGDSLQIEFPITEVELAAEKRTRLYIVRVIAVI